MSEPLSIQERAAEMLRGVPDMCRPSHISAAIGVTSQCIIDHLKRGHMPIVRLPSGHRRIPKPIQKKIVEEFIRQGWNG